jgi:hypothetical protein
VTGDSLHDRPSAAELVAAVREFLEHDVMAATEGRVQFHTRVAVNVLNMVQRELEGEPAATAEARRALAGLVGHDGTAQELTAELARAIRAGDLDDRHDDVVATLRGIVRAKVTVTNPRYVDEER